MECAPGPGGLVQPFVGGQDFAPGAFFHLTIQNVREVNETMTRKTLLKTTFENPQRGETRLVQPTLPGEPGTQKTAYLRTSMTVVLAQLDPSKRETNINSAPLFDFNRSAVPHPICAARPFHRRPSLQQGCYPQSHCPPTPRWTRS